jgi:putative methyltransferase (TIGR04325 family)
MLRPIHERRFERNRSENLFCGVYESMEAAAAARPVTRPLGYDNDESATLYAPVNRPESHDYPAMFWLGRAMAEGARAVFDVGGHVGLKFYAFREILGFDDALSWTVCDVPAVVRQGRTIAAERKVSGQLRFTDDYGALSGHDLLFASGSLQYLPMTLGDWLRGVIRPPHRILINTTPLHHDRSFFTLNSIGTACCPYRVMHEASLVRQLDAIGYRVVDRWFNVGKSLRLPLEDGYDVEAYRGLYLVRDRD